MTGNITFRPRTEIPILLRVIPQTVKMWDLPEKSLLITNFFKIQQQKRLNMFYTRDLFVIHPVETQSIETSSDNTYWIWYKTPRLAPDFYGLAVYYSNNEIPQIVRERYLSDLIVWYIPKINDVNNESDESDDDDKDGDDIDKHQKPSVSDQSVYGEHYDLMFTKSPLMLGIQNQDTNYIKDCLETEVVIQSYDRSIFTPLHLACVCGNLDVLKLLVNSKKFDFSVKYRNLSCLDIAVESKSHKIVEYLVNECTELLLDADPMGFITLTIAIVMRDNESLQYFLDSTLFDRMISHKDSFQMNSFDWAVRFENHYAIHKILQLMNNNEQFIQSIRESIEYSILMNKNDILGIMHHNGINLPPKVLGNINITQDFLSNLSLEDLKDEKVKSEVPTTTTTSSVSNTTSSLQFKPMPVTSDQNQTSISYVTIPTNPQKINFESSTSSIDKSSSLYSEFEKLTSSPSFKNGKHIFYKSENGYCTDPSNDFKLYLGEDSLREISKQYINGKVPSEILLQVISSEKQGNNIVVEATQIFK
ncbi:hypothetical protein DLAC_06954 [Tieghemostelium lacteum]|uniref:Uncharacterized protein n=1 Tax=Tieghemostelium lacteum TaxID=361077 RepID=A0A151ZDZ6_TIELA|nr:hypothetical protein DLAC_06954 [Tieghemostelium lacteum]|eukprot:KYQ92114.1 hypothetical protein DLAC_06954 [Tieghemostelium lacteum]